MNSQSNQPKKKAHALFSFITIKPFLFSWNIFKYTLLALLLFAIICLFTDFLDQSQRNTIWIILICVLCTQSLALKFFRLLGKDNKFIAELNAKQIISLILIFLSLIFLSFSLLASDNSWWADFGLNAFTETLGVTLTVLVIDYLFQKQKEVNILPRRVATFDDIVLLHNRSVKIFHDIHSIAGNSKYNRSIEELLNPQHISKSSHLLSVMQILPINPKTGLPKLIDNSIDKIDNNQKLAEKILARHQLIICHDAYKIIHKLCSLPIPSESLKGAQQFGVAFEILFDFSVENSNIIRYLNKIQKLNEWVVQEHEELTNLGCIDLRPIVI